MRRFTTLLTFILAAALGLAMNATFCNHHLSLLLQLPDGLFPARHDLAIPANDLPKRTAADPRGTETWGPTTLEAYDKKWHQARSVVFDGLEAGGLEAGERGRVKIPNPQALKKAEKEPQCPPMSLLDCGDEDCGGNEVDRCTKVRWFGCPCNGPVVMEMYVCGGAGTQHAEDMLIRRRAFWDYDDEKIEKILSEIGR